jgi:hypothetical protein
VVFDQVCGPDRSQNFKIVWAIKFEQARPYQDLVKSIPKEIDRPGSVIKASTRRSAGLIAHAAPHRIVKKAPASTVDRPSAANGNVLVHYGVKAVRRNHGRLKRIHIEVPDDHRIRKSDTGLLSSDNVSNISDSEGLVFFFGENLAPQMYRYQQHLLPYRRTDASHRNPLIVENWAKRLKRKFAVEPNPM